MYLCTFPGPLKRKISLLIYTREESNLFHFLTESIVLISIPNVDSLTKKTNKQRFIRVWKTSVHSSKVPTSPVMAANLAIPLLNDQ